MSYHDERLRRRDQVAYQQRRPTYEYESHDDPDETLLTRTRGNTSVVRVPRRPEPRTTTQREIRYREPKSPLVYIGGTAAVVLLALLAVLQVGQWWKTYQDDQHYGRPRTFQIDAVVGHGDSDAHPSHFVVMNLAGRVVVFEIQGGDPSKVKSYAGATLMGDQGSLTPVTAHFQDSNGDGKPDMVLSIEGQNFYYTNTGTEFKPQQ